jgi:hypothetical protein
MQIDEDVSSHKGDVLSAKDIVIFPSSRIAGIRDRAGVVAAAIIHDIKTLLPTACHSRVAAALRPRLEALLRDEFSAAAAQVMNDIRLVE